MKLDYKVLLTLLIIISLCIVSGLLLFGAIGSNPVASVECNSERVLFRQKSLNYLSNSRYC